MFKLFHSLWRSAARKATKAQRKQTRTLIRNVVKPAMRASAAKPVAKKPLAHSSSWHRARFSSLNTDPARGVLIGTRMEYWLYQPSALRAGTVPLIVMLHGCAQSAVEFAEGTRMNALGESKDFGVLYPQQSMRMNPQRCWHWYKKSVQGGKGEAALVAELIAHVVRRYGFDPTRIYVAGISAGAAMAQIISLHHPQLIAAVGLHSAPQGGVAHDAISAYAVMQHGAHAASPAWDSSDNTAASTARAMPAILIQGLQDSVVRPVNATQLEAQFCERNALTDAQRQPPVHHAAGTSARSAHAFDTVDYRRGRQILLRVCRIVQLEHAWSGGDPSYRFNERKGPDASRMMWNFFSRHCREHITTT